MFKILPATAVAMALLLTPALKAQTAAPEAGAAANAAPARTPVRPATDSTYRINAGDELEIYVWGEERLQRKVKVLPDGTIAFPLVGQIKVQNYLPSEVEALITSGLSAQYVGAVPQVTVSVVVPSGMQFSVMGRVKSPGTFSPGRYINVLEALSMAGGRASSPISTMSSSFARPTASSARSTCAWHRCSGRAAMRATLRAATSRRLRPVTPSSCDDARGG